MIDLRAARLALRAILVTVAELPSSRAWENVRYTPDAASSYVADKMAGSKVVLRSATAASGVLEATGLYIVKLYTIALRGDEEVEAIVAGILAAFPLGARTTLPNGDQLRIEGDVGIDVSDVVPVGANKVQCTITIPWAAFSFNSAVLSLTA